jgi:excisionase family DNA binding protein
MAAPQSAASPAGPNRRTRRDIARGRAYVGIPDAAAYLDVDHKTIRRLIASGDLPAGRVGKRLIKIRLSDLDALVVPMTGSGAA